MKLFPLVVARQRGIMRSWQKAGKKKAFSHLQRWDKAEVEKATSVIPTLVGGLKVLFVQLLGTTTQIPTGAQ